MTLEVKKVSLHSIQTDKIVIDKNLKKKWNGLEEPKDRYYFVHVLFIFLGLMHFIPFTFFLTANAYWMYKFRNTSAEITDTDARTTLQTHFSPGCTMAATVPMTVLLLASTLYGHKIKTRTRVLGSLIVFTVCFVLMTGFVKTNTDSWQLGFFVLTMFVLAVIYGANAVMEIATLSILSRFPQYFMKVYLMGQGFAGIFNSVLQIFSLALGTSTTTSALVYFVVGSAMMGFTLVLHYFSKYNTCYNWYLSTFEEDTKRKVIPFSEAKSLAKTLWPCILMYLQIMFTILATHTAITALVVSEDYGNGNPWNDTYFVPVITFLYSEIIGLLGRIANAKINKSINKYLLNIIMFVRMLIFVPLIYFCNAQPRHHFDVLLPHDWQYILIMGLFSFTNGYTFNMVFLEIGKAVEPEKVEDAFMVFMSCSAIVGPLLTPVSIFAVDIL